MQRLRSLLALLWQVPFCLVAFVVLWGPSFLGMALLTLGDRLTAWQPNFPRCPRWLSRLALLTVATLSLLTAGCGGLPSATPPGVTLGDGAQIENGCLIEAIHADEELQAARVPAEVVGIYYRMDGRTYGHAGVAFVWHDQWTGVDRWWWDRTNASQPLRASLSDPMAIARALFADPVSAHVITAPAAAAP